MKLRSEKLTQPTLTDEFSRWEPGPRRAVVKVVKHVHVHVHMSAAEQRMEARQGAETEQRAKMEEFKRLLGEGLSRAEASRKVWP